MCSVCERDGVVIGRNRVENMYTGRIMTEIECVNIAIVQRDANARVSSHHVVRSNSRAIS